MFSDKFQIKSALFYFLIAGFLGVVLRLVFYFDIPLEYRHIVHGHSHLALLGWVYIAMITILSKLYLADVKKKKIHRRIISLTHVTIIGMMFTFPFQGYALCSIIFSSLFLILSYWFIVFFVRNTPSEKKTFSYKIIRAALLLMVLSSIGPWTLGAIMSTLGQDSVLYKIAIYFYLHFLYNGAFILFLVGLVFRVFEDCKVQLSHKWESGMLTLFLSSIFLSFFLSILFSGVPIIVNALSILGAVLQLTFFILLIRVVISNWAKLIPFHSSMSKWILRLIALFIIVKCVLQLLSGFPYFVDLTLKIYDFIISYLHLVFLGVISLSLMFFIDHFKLLKIPKSTIVLFLAGVILSEGLLVYRGISSWNEIILINGFDTMLVCASALIPMSFLPIFFLSERKR